MTTTSRRHRPATTAATVLLGLAVLAGCATEKPTDDEVTSSAPVSQDEESATSAGPEDTDGAEQTAQPSDDAAVTSSGPVVLTAADGSFTVEIPGTWEDALELVEDEAVIVAAKDRTLVDGFFTNVVVTQEEYVRSLTSAVEEAAVELAGEDGEHTMLEPAAVDGNTAPGFVIVREVEGTTMHQTQRWISHDGTLYIVTLSALEEQAEESAELLDDILASWTWTD